MPVYPVSYLIQTHWILDDFVIISSLLKLNEGLSSWVVFQQIYYCEQTIIISYIQLKYNVMIKSYGLTIDIIIDNTREENGLVTL